MIELRSNPRTILKVLSHLKEGIFSIKDISESTGLPFGTIREIVDPLIEENCIKEKDGKLMGNEVATITLSFQAFIAGAALEEIFRIIRWQDFENFVSIILSEQGFNTFRNYRLKKPRLEIDVLALKKNFGLVIDCKQWQKVLSASNLNTIVSKQIERTKTLLSIDQRIGKDIILVPAIVTLFPSRENFFENVPIIAANSLKSFASEIDGRTGEVLKVFKDKEGIKLER
jgi:predicted transcriptional regulator